jgi:hypothetical protein
VNRAKLAAAACALLMVTAACGAPYSDAAQTPLAVRSSTSTSRNAEPSSRPPNQQVLDGDLTITVATPRSFTPTAAASPHAERAVAFELVIGNEGKTAYRPAELSIMAVCDGANARQLVDSTQGYTGFVSSSDEVAPGKSVRVVVAFAVPREQAMLRLSVQQDATEGGPVTVFEGTV